MAARGDENIRGLDVAMDDAFGVRGIEGVGDLDGEFEGFFDGQRLAGNAVLQRLAFEVLHGDEGPSVFLGDFVNGADVGVIEGGGGAGFALEAFESGAIFGHIVGEEFQGDEATEGGVFGFVDHAHAAATEFFDNAIVGDGAAD